MAVAATLSSSLPFFSSRIGLDRRRMVFCCSSSSLPSTEVTTTIPKGWKSFSKNVSGEWSGAGVDFDATGKPIELPSSVVPEEYNEWGVKLHDWETYAATLATDKTPTFYNKTLRLYPTVGCGGTTVSIYKTEERSINMSDSQDDAWLAFHSNGSYIAVWEKQKVVEHCLVNEDSQEGSRMRILQTLKDFGQPSIDVITVYKEQWEEDFQSGKTVESCLTRPAGISVGRRLHPGDIRGSWKTLKFSCSCAESKTTCNSINKLAVNKSTSNEFDRQYLDSHVLLPQGLWSNAKNVGDDVEVEGGWLINRGLALVSKCTFSSGIVQKLDLEIQYRDSKIKKTYRTFRLDDSQDPVYS